jgi:hypothetical protein
MKSTLLLFFLLVLVFTDIALALEFWFVSILRSRGSTFSLSWFFGNIDLQT